MGIRNASQCGSDPPPAGSLACNGPKALLCAWQGDDVKTAADKLGMEKCIAGTEMQPVAACLSDADSAACRGQLETCLASQGFSKTKPLACYDGDQGLQLVKTAADEWNAAAPVKGYIPCVFVDGHGLKARRTPLPYPRNAHPPTAHAPLAVQNATHCDVPTLTTYEDVKDALCAAGSTSPACGKKAAATSAAAAPPDAA